MRSIANEKHRGGESTIGRIHAGMDLALKSAEIRQLKSGLYRIESAASGRYYTVDLERKTCTCLDHAARGYRCKHIVGCAIIAAQDEQPRADYWIEVREDVRDVDGRRLGRGYVVCERFGRFTLDHLPGGNYGTRRDRYSGPVVGLYDDLESAYRARGELEGAAR